MGDHAWLAIYLALLVVPWGLVELSAVFGLGGQHPTMSRVIAHLEAEDGRPLRIGIATLIAALSLLLTLHLGFQAV
jgi:hypothetical protein